MATPFFEVFSTLQLKDVLRDVMEQTVVERISSPKNRNMLHIYLLSKRLINSSSI